MKNTLIIVLTVAVLALGTMFIVQSRVSTARKVQLAALRGEAQVQSQQLQDLQAAQQRAAKQRRELASHAEELEAQLRARRLADTNLVAPAPPRPAPVAVPKEAEGAPAGFGKMLAKMMQDPDTREVMRTQQRMMADQMYGPLIKRLGLDPEHAAQFKDMLTDHLMGAADKAGSVFEALGSTNRTDAIKSMTDQQKSFDEQVKDFLGDDAYAQYKDYTETMGERMLLNQFKQQAGSDFNLNDQQTEALLGIMNEEKKSVAQSTGLPLANNEKDPAKLQALLSDNKIDELLQAQERVGQRVYDRARTFLSPEQLETWGKFQTNQLQMMRMGMTMAKKMFAPPSTPPQDR